MKKFKEFINEAKLTRIVQHISKYDCATISAFRVAKDCDGEEVYSLKENKARSMKLESQLLLKKYGVISVKGSYVENFGSANAKEVLEDSFFVMNLQNDENFKKTIMTLALEYDQDSILYIPKTEIDRKGTCDAYLISTNECPDAFPGKGKIGVEKKYKNIKLNKFDEFMTKVGDKPFYFTENINDNKINIFNGSYNSGIGMHYASKTDWRNLIQEGDD